MIGIFGGTFDPVHLGHRQAVDQLLDRLPMELLHWVLSARPPHKDQVTASTAHRFAMLGLALLDEPRYLADDTEIVRAQKSYTIDTVYAFKKRYPEKPLCVVIGGDSLQNLHSWRQYEELMRSVNWVVMHRPGYPLEVPRELESRLVESPAELLKHKSGKLWVFSDSNIDVSSTQLRNALAEFQKTGIPSSSMIDSLIDESSEHARMVRDFLDRKVLSYIREHKLYATHDIEREGSDLQTHY